MKLRHSSGKRAAAAVMAGAVFVGAVHLPAQAQESVNNLLDACVQQEQLDTTIKGAAIGALAGLASSMLGGDRKKNTGQAVLVGAVAGGAIGFATAYYKSVGNCYKKNPTWVPESQVQRSGSLAKAKAALNYDPSMGPVAKATDVAMRSKVKAGGNIEMVSKYIALTPDDAEAELTIERKLFIIEDGKESEIPFPGQQREVQRVEAGAGRIRSTLPVPEKTAPGTAFRYEFSVAMAGGPASTAVGTTTVR